ncbi:hypothetical protein MMC07_004007 [Pseudocyphellaria aurata]|nr:hypothetical protein [Pseudocyphellaria aurata]
MAPQINVTVDRVKQLNAARALSGILDTLGIRHAVLGGFAVALYGGERHTKDVDVLVDISAKDIQDVLRPRMSEINGDFAQMGLRYYLVPRLVEGLEGEQLVLANEENTLIETLPTNTLRLPMAITDSMILQEGDGEECSGKPIMISLKKQILTISRPSNSTSEHSCPDKAQAVGNDMLEYFPSVRD